LTKLEIFADGGKKERKAGSFVSFAAVSRGFSNQPRADPQILDIAFSGG